ncbi:MAG: hypothetical protein E6G57_09930, partial [Actinobacteria bacterium]
MFGPKPATPAANTLYTTNEDSSKKGAAFQLAYRVYRPDKGKDDRGGVPLPSITVNLPGGGSIPVPDCDIPGLPPNGINDAIANTNGLPLGPPWPGTDPPVW